MSSQDEVKNTASKPNSGDVAKGGGGSRRNRGSSSGARYSRDGKEYDAKDKTAKTEQPATSEKTAPTERKTRAPYNKQPAKSAADISKNQKQGKTQNQQKTEKYVNRAPVKNPQRDGEVFDGGTAARGAAPQAARTGTQKSRQPQERVGDQSGEHSGGVRGGERERNPQINREQTPRGQAPGETIKGGAAGVPPTPAPRPHGYQNTAGGGRGRYASNAHAAKIKVEETLEDIKSDIIRIEKEIGLEIKEIQSLKLA